MFTTTVRIPVSPAELAEVRAEETRRNDARTREQLYRSNREANKPEPRSGDKLFVASARGIKNRSRAGLLFSEQPAEVLVINEPDAAITAKQKAGTYVVNPYGAEQILADSNEPGTGLVVFASKPDAQSRDFTKMSEEQLEEATAELARRRAAPSMKGEERISSSKAKAEVETKAADAKTAKDDAKK